MTDEEIRALFEEFRAALECKLSAFEFHVEELYEHGEYEAAILNALLFAGAEGVPVSDDLIDRAGQLFTIGRQHDMFVYAVNKIRDIEPRSTDPPIRDMESFHRNFYAS